MRIEKLIKKYGIIRRQGGDCGLCSFIITNMGGINYCLENSLIPVIDMQTIKNQYIGEKDVGKINAWELFFEQPMGYGLENIGRKSMVIDGCDMIRPNLSMDFLTNSYLVGYWRDLFHKYIQFQPHIADALEDNYKKVFEGIEKKDVMGVLCRGTDYRILKPKQHPVQPDNDYMVSLVKSKMKEWGKDRIFLVTEDKSIIDAFERKFGDKVFYCEGTRYELSKSIFLAEHIENTGNDSVEQGMEYLSSIYCLSKCDSMVAGRTSGSVVAHLMASSTQKAYFVNLGSYGYDDKMTDYMINLDIAKRI